MIPASLLRRIGAIFYDLLILLAILMISTWILMPLTDGEAIKPGDLTYQLYLFVVCSGYYLGFWVYGGQTLGMLAWGIKVQTVNGKPLTWARASRRLFWGIVTLMPGGVGLWLALFQHQKQTWYDVLAKTELIRYTPK